MCDAYLYSLILQDFARQ